MIQSQAVLIITILESGYTTVATAATIGGETGPAFYVAESAAAVINTAFTAEQEKQSRGSQDQAT